MRRSLRVEQATSRSGLELRVTGFANGQSPNAVKFSKKLPIPLGDWGDLNFSPTYSSRNNRCSPP
jgi:hypothetical protein